MVGGDVAERRHSVGGTVVGPVGHRGAAGQRLGPPACDRKRAAHFATPLACGIAYPVTVKNIPTARPAP